MRICLYGGAGIGKSLLAAFLFDRLNRDGHGVELVTEAIKPLAYRGQQLSRWGAARIFHEQLGRELDWLEAGVPHLVTDSPLWLQCFYAQRYRSRALAGLEAHTRAFEEDWPALHVVLERGGFGYRTAGRYEDEAQATAVDRELRDYLRQQGVPARAAPAADRAAVLALAQRALAGQCGGAA